MGRQKNNLKIHALFMAAICVFLASPAQASASLDNAKAIPILNNGRVKAFDSFCRQTLEKIAGKETWNKKDAVSVLLGIIASEEKIDGIPWVLVGNAELRSAFGLPADKRYFSYAEIIPSLEKILASMKSSQEKRDADKSTSSLEKETESLYARLVAVRDLMTGESLRLIPSSDKNGEVWLTLAESANTEHGRRFKTLLKLFSEKKMAEFNAETGRWNVWVHETTHDAYRGTIQLEVIYSDAKPFQWAWIFYLAAFIMLSFFKKLKFVKKTGIVLVASAMVFHTLGLVLRVLVLQRPPVSNMYESMVYMNWAVMVFAAFFALGTRNVVYLSAGSALSALVMIYGDLLPIDANLEVLVPVLRSNYWLTVHVMTIVSSYGAFGLAMALGHRHLILEMKGKFSKTAQEDSAQLIYRVIQLGILLLGIGTVLGGVWANESWGRFWGWDPKETWALITFVAYLVVVHLKYAKKIDSHWLAMSSVLGFFFVLMTWYGVNFVLGRGLHSYGFGSGGMKWIIYYVVAEIVFLGVVGSRRAHSDTNHRTAATHK